jgi:transposase-like protein
MAETGVTPERVVTDQAACYPPALRALLPTAEHRCWKYLNNGLERDHGHLNQRMRPMRGFKRLASADRFARGHALIQNLRYGYSTLTTGGARPLRVAAAWPPLTRAL